MKFLKMISDEQIQMLIDTAGVLQRPALGSPFSASIFTGIETTKLMFTQMNDELQSEMFNGLTKNMNMKP